MHCVLSFLPRALCTIEIAGICYCPCANLAMAILGELGAAQEVVQHLLTGKSVLLYKGA